MKVFVDKRRHGRHSSIRFRDNVLLKQSKINMLTPAYDPRPYTVIGFKGSMITVKRGKEIKARTSSYCKVLKHAEEDSMQKYVEDDDDNAYWEPSQCGSQKRGQHLEVEGDSEVRGSAEHGASGESMPAPVEPRRSMQVRTSTWNTIYKDFEAHKINI